MTEDLIGPKDGPEEILPPEEERVSERYLAGMLAPKRTSVNPCLMDDIGLSTGDSWEEGTADTSPVQSATMFPSAMGMTFSLIKDADTLRITARWGRYERLAAEARLSKKTGKFQSVWKRSPVEGVIDIPVKEGRTASLPPNPEYPQVGIQGRMRKTADGWLVTLFLVNGQEQPKKDKDSAWLFQAEMIAESPDRRPVFQRRQFQKLNLSKMDEIGLSEHQAYAMLYRNHSEFAAGHSIGVHAEISPEHPGRAVRLETRAIPSWEIPKVTPPDTSDNPDLGDVVLDMKALAQAKDAELPEMLTPLITAYKKWIGAEEQNCADPSQELTSHEAAAREALAGCRKALSRISEGIALISANKNAADAFRFANRAMWHQRIRSVSVKAVRKGNRTPFADTKDIDRAENRSWYPFQLAFMLLNLPGITDLSHKERSESPDALADLLWFPTGGGKTEAYLGLTAYTLALRRLQGNVSGRSGEHGVGVIMRYTLRLLTLQQFQRATALICACEVIRREAPEKWGENPFRIGLWVGMKATPNTTEQAKEAIESRSNSRNTGGAGSPAQLTLCPWCGTPIDPGKNIKVYPGMRNIMRTVLYCGDSMGRCPFSERNSPNEGIPAMVVDDEIYRNPPGLLIATVDKFAQMPWKGEIQMLFGQVSRYCPRHGFRSPEIYDSDSHPGAPGLPAVKSEDCPLLRPPDLIIQDELHLISGPLGSMVGLYETAIDELCSWTVSGRKVRPKVIASTATIRRARTQIQRIFMRELSIFPPHGTSAEDNFFAISRPPSDAYPGRRYLGVCAIGRRMPAIQIRVYIALLGAAQKLFETYDTAADPWMTLTGYFNSLRELGGTRRLVEDSITSRLKKADQRGLATRGILRLEELTSRKSSTEIPEILDRLETGFCQAEQKEQKSRRKSGKKLNNPPLDVLIATNMISVGVDVDRLGLMAVTGQPKSSAEYIQATSRVGRKHPGLVVIIYNWTRPRDLSHYERFEHYHATFYQHVEALSVTPFAARALERGLSGILVSLIRLLDERLNANYRAGELTPDDELLIRAAEAIIRRVQGIGETRESVQKVREMLDERKEFWLGLIEATKMGQVVYQRQRDGVSTELLKPAGVSSWELFTCLNSLRNVEPAVNLIINNG
jgi:hypothetical protein